MKLTTPHAILIGFALLALAILCNGNALFVAEAQAEANDFRAMQRSLSNIERSLQPYGGIGSDIDSMEKNLQTIATHCASR